MLKQIVIQPTRDNILDLCFISHPDLSQECAIIPNLNDHDAVVCNFISLFTESTRYLENLNLQESKLKCCQTLHSKFVRRMLSFFNETQSRNIMENWQYVHPFIHTAID